MKLTKLANLMVLGTSLTIAAVGCRHTPERTTNIPGTKPDLAGRNRPMTGDGVAITQTPKTQAFENNVPPGGGEMTTNHFGWIEDTAALSGSTVYFDYDKSAIRSGEQSKLDQVADYLRSHPNAALRIDGNCDERGTEEYNRSLGERRALAGREHLVRLGIDPNRIDTNTYGKDKPADTGHTEAAHAKNRRDEFIVLTAPK
jgi:peptidoglycan-associated lipoprotein